MPFKPPSLPIDQDGAVHPARLVDEVDYFWPWPYTPNQIEALGRTIPLAETRRADCLRGVVAIARQSVIGRHYQDRQAGAPKLSVKADIQRVGTARRELLGALKELSMEGHEFLQRRDERWSKQHAAALMAMMDFEYVNLDASDAPGSGLGPPGDVAIVWAAHQLDLWWTASHGGKRPKNGFPAFRDAALKPLFGEFSANTLGSRLPKWRADMLPPISPQKTPR